MKNTAEILNHFVISPDVWAYLQYSIGYVNKPTNQATLNFPSFTSVLKKKISGEVKLLKILHSTHVCTQIKTSQKILGTNIHIKKTIEKISMTFQEARKKADYDGNSYLSKTLL